MIVIFLFITIGVLWYVGNKNRTERQANLDKYYQALIDKNRSLNSVVSDNLSTKGELQTFDPSALYQTASLPLNSLPTSTPANLQNYHDQITEILIPLQKTRENEAKTMLTVLDTKDKTRIKDIVAARLSYEQMADDLLKTMPPADVITIHRDLYQSLKRLAALAGNMEKVLDEPVLALQSGQTYLSEANNLLQQIGKLNAYFLDKKIISSANEGIKIYFKLD